MKTISIFLAGVNALLAGVILVSTLTSMGNAKVPWRPVAKIYVASTIIAAGALTGLAYRRTVHGGLQSLYSLSLVMLGAAIVAWTVYLVLASGDMEYRKILFGGSLAVQGVVSLFGFATNARPLTPL